LLHRSIDQVERGETPILVIDDAKASQIRGPYAIDGIGPTQGWEGYYRDVDAKRRQDCPWAAAAPIAAE
jgi:hypothetical protein